MAELLKTVTLKFKRSFSPDIVGYKLYVKPAPDPVDRISSQVFDLGNPPADADDMISVDIASLPDAMTMDGVYNLGVAAIDDAGNESSLLTEGLENIALDFVAPDPPTSATVIYS